MNIACRNGIFRPGENPERLWYKTRSGTIRVSGGGIVVIEKELLKAQVILPTELQGEVLIITPAGEAFGYKESMVSTEMKRLQRTIECDEVQHLVIDASQSNYFGSAIIGLLHSLAAKIQAKGGQVAMCGASQDLSAIMDVLNLGQDWHWQDTLRKSIQAVRKG